MDGKDDPLQPFYSPLIDKSMSFDMGYVSRKSGHTRGSTVDITIIKKGHQVKPIVYRLRELENGRLIYLLDDGT